ncbi:MAG TPA: DUF5615 family PIN-like protein [Chloroflexota bacterium]|nr:DUF5615 family PIN-like protein [Chloroflexota bacterium]
MVALYLDENTAQKRVARPLRAAGHTLYLAQELALAGAADMLQLETATKLGAVIVTKDISDFPRLHEEWQASGREHAGIVLCRELETGRRFTYLERVARLLTPEAARNQLMHLDMFKIEELAEAYVIALTPATGTYT